MVFSLYPRLRHSSCTLFSHIDVVNLVLLGISSGKSFDDREDLFSLFGDLLLVSTSFSTSFSKRFIRSLAVSMCSDCRTYGSIRGGWGASGCLSVRSSCLNELKLIEEGSRIISPPPVSPNPMFLVRSMKFPSKARLFELFSLEKRCGCFFFSLCSSNLFPKKSWSRSLDRRRGGDLSPFLPSLENCLSMSSSRTRITLSRDLERIRLRGFGSSHKCTLDFLPLSSKFNGGFLDKGLTERGRFFRGGDPRRMNLGGEFRLIMLPFQCYNVEFLNFGHYYNSGRFKLTRKLVIND